MKERDPRGFDIKANDYEELKPHTPEDVEEFNLRFDNTPGMSKVFNPAHDEIKKPDSKPANS